MKRYRKFGSGMCARRRAVGLTQEGLAERCGMSARQLSSIENGKALPKLDTVLKLCAACGIDAGELPALAEGVVGEDNDVG